MILKIRKIISKTALKGLLIFLFILSAVSFAETYPELEKTIKDLKKKIKATQQQSKQVNKKSNKDKEEFADYERRNNNYLSQQQKELDKLKEDYNKIHRKSDSVSRIIGQVKGRQKELDLQQKAFRNSLIKACNTLRQTLVLLPPGNVKGQMSSLDFLHSEIKTNAVDNVEALERLWQILSALTEGSQTIETFSAQSPVSYISGQVDFVKLGYAYLAIVNEKGTKGALWKPMDDTLKGIWQEIDDPEQLSALKKCIQIRQGTIVPQIIDIPFRHPIQADQEAKKGGTQ